MRTTQYAFVLITQIFLLCVMFMFGTRATDFSSYQGSPTNTSGVDQSTPRQGVDGLYDHLSR